MSNTTMEVLTVEAVNQYGFKSGGKNYSISALLAKKGITPQSFTPGTQIQAEIWTGPQGGKKVNSFQLYGGVTAPAMPQMPPMPPQYANAPALPVTSVATTPAPGGVPPVSKLPPAVKDEDKMSKSDWADRNREIALQAIVKSSIESPALAEHVTGKSTPEVFELTRQYVKHNLETYRMAVQGLL